MLIVSTISKFVLQKGKTFLTARITVNNQTKCKMILLYLYAYLVPKLFTYVTLLLFCARVCVCVRACVRACVGVGACVHVRLCLFLLVPVFVCMLVCLCACVCGMVAYIVSYNMLYNVNTVWR